MIGDVAAPVKAGLPRPLVTEALIHLSTPSLDALVSILSPPSSQPTMAAGHDASFVLVALMARGNKTPPLRTALRASVDELPDGPQDE